jgi:hypothetical protein
MVKSSDGTNYYIMIRQTASSTHDYHAVVTGLVGVSAEGSGNPLNPIFITPTVSSSSNPPGAGMETITLMQAFDLTSALLALPVYS